MLRVRLNRSRCIGAGNCIRLAPTAFEWYAGEFKAIVTDVESVEDELIRIAALACPTAAIDIEEVEELLPWQLTQRTHTTRRVVKTFMFTDIVQSTQMLELLGEEGWQDVLRWHDDTLRAAFAAHEGTEISATGDGFFISFDSPDAALACAVAVQRTLAEHRKRHGFAPRVRIGLHASGATQVRGNYQGRGVHEAARIAALAESGEILASLDTVRGGHQTHSPPRAVELKGFSEPIDVVSVEWR